MRRSRAVVQLIACIIALVGLLALLALVFMSAFKEGACKDVPDVPLLESPLDAIAYESPEFAGGAASYEVCDRRTGERWWLVSIGGDLVALPTEGK